MFRDLPRPISRSLSRGLVRGQSRLLPSLIAMATQGSVSNHANNNGFVFPADVQPDDLFLAVLLVNDRNAGATITDEADQPGYVLIDKIEDGEVALAAWYYRADGTESAQSSGAPFDWAAGDTSNCASLCQAFQFRNVDWEQPIDGEVVQLTAEFPTVPMPEVTTVEPNSLAMAICGCTDNVTFSEPAGETGGSWFSSHGSVSNTAADDTSMRVFTADMVAPGTISGGSETVTPTSPVTSVAGMIGFALRGRLA